MNCTKKRDVRAELMFCLSKLVLFWCSRRRRRRRCSPYYKVAMPSQI